MNLKDIRKQKGLTQKQAALLIGVPYRTYLRYEEDPKYIDTYKYQMIISSLEDKTKIDEEHGLLDIETIKKVLLPILKDKGISYCYVFGSYARANPKENSDIDLLVDTDKEIQSNYIYSDAIQFEFEKLYEDSTRLSFELRINHPELHINELRGIRNRVAHNYESVSIKILFDTIKVNIPELKKTIEEFLKVNSN